MKPKHRLVKAGSNLIARTFERKIKILIPESLNLSYFLGYKP